MEIQDDTERGKIEVIRIENEAKLLKNKALLIAEIGRYIKYWTLILLGFLIVFGYMILKKYPWS